MFRTIGETVMMTVPWDRLKNDLDYWGVREPRLGRI